MTVILQCLRPEDRETAARIYWEAFGGKLGAVLGPEEKAKAFLLRVLRSDHCISALDGTGRLVGIAGFKSPQGSFAGGSREDLIAVYGYLGALWRSALLWFLSHEVDNHRFLIDGIAVARGGRGQGVGTSLLKALGQEARWRGYTSVRLEVVDSNWRARALYERQGFVATRTEKLGLLKHLFGFNAAITMVRPLN